MSSRNLKHFASIGKLILITIFSLPACNNRHNQKALSDLFNKATYDTKVIHDLSFYDSLKNILILHLDTIFKFRDARTNVYHGSGEDSGQITHEPHDFYKFQFKWNLSDETSDNDISLKTVPAFIYPAVKHIFEGLGKDRIGGIMIWSDSTIEIGLPEGFIDEKTKATVQHTLRWKRIFLGEPLIKDTIIAPGWHYEIAVLEYEEK